MQKVRLTYFGARGSCDKVRLLMALADVDYEEISIAGRDFARLKGELEFGELPLLEDGELRIVHSAAILRHLARKVGLYGTNYEEAALCDMWMEQIEEVQRVVWNADFLEGTYSEFKQKELKDNFMRQTLGPALTGMAKMMSRNETMFLVGNKLTFVDVALFALLESINRELPLAIPEFPLLAFFWETMKNFPRIKDFYNSPRRF